MKIQTSGKEASGRHPSRKDHRKTSVIIVNNPNKKTTLVQQPSEYVENKLINLAKDQNTLD